jgi:hypothetical protein
MPVDFADFADVLRDLGVAGQVRELPEPAPTSFSELIRITNGAPADVGE